MICRVLQVGYQSNNINRYQRYQHTNLNLCVTFAKKNEKDAIKKNFIFYFSHFFLDSAPFPTSSHPLHRKKFPKKKASRRFGIESVSDCELFDKLRHQKKERKKERKNERTFPFLCSPSGIPAESAAFWSVDEGPASVGLVGDVDRRRRRRHAATHFFLIGSGAISGALFPSAAGRQLENETPKKV